MAECRLCPRECGIDRDEKRGFCGVGARAKVARAALHMWEEPCISGTRGSGAVFFSGCTLKCAYCQNQEISRGGVGKEIDDGQLRRMFENLKAQGAHNINLVTPTQFAPNIVAALREPIGIPVVMNCGGYESLSTLDMLAPYVNVYLPDMKYVDTELSRELSGAPDYFECASRAIIHMCELAGPNAYDADDMLTRGVLVRHLVLPGHISNSIRVLRWIKAELPEWVRISVMAQYTPCGDVRARGLNRRLSRMEYDRVLDEVYKLGLEDGYLQELTSADESYIPPFDMTGVDD